MWNLRPDYVNHYSLDQICKLSRPRDRVFSLDIIQPIRMDCLTYWADPLTITNRMHFQRDQTKLTRQTIKQHWSALMSRST